jgi:4-amino-4-deoxy-L-arabinose transferase-like glycosyltransferase
MPWTVYLPAAIRRFYGRFHQGHLRLAAERDFSYLVSLYALVWSITVFIFFSLSQTKLLTYILPMFPALALILAETWHSRRVPAVEGNAKEGYPNSDRWFTGAAWVLLVILAVGGILFITRMDRLLPHEASGVTANTFNTVAVCLVILGSGAAAWLLQCRRAAAALVCQVLTIALMVIVALDGIVPNISLAAQGTMRRYLAQSQNRPLILYEIQRPSLTFYSRRRIPRFVNTDRVKLLNELKQHPETLVITREQHLPDFGRHLPATMHFEILEKDGAYRLLSVSNTNRTMPR